MSHTVDASVWVAAFRREEPHHNEAIRYFKYLAAINIPVVAPAILLAERGATFVRTVYLPDARPPFPE